MLKKIKIIIFALLAMLFWGSSFVWFKEVYVYYKPVTVTVARLSISYFLLLIWAKSTNKYEIIKKEDLKSIMLLAFAEPFCYFIGESFGMQFVSPTLGAIIISTIPLITPFFAYFILKERITLWTIGGLILSFYGVIIIVSQNSIGEISFLGIGLMFFAVISGTLYGIFLKRVIDKYSAVTIVRYQNFFGFLYFLPLFLFIELDDFLAVPFSWQAIEPIFKLAIFGSTLAFILFTQVIRNIGLSIANLYANFIPVFTTIVAYFVLEEPITSRKLLGISIVISGLLLSQTHTFFKIRKVDN
ncbi:MAG: DMT family transporter [Candidatus Cloacimonadota bacterium]|nr:DMT family transporter [Candidatus Cloacimonadota bacterium]